MGKTTDRIWDFIKGQTTVAVFGIAVAVTLVVFAVLMLRNLSGSGSITVTTNRKIDITPAQIQSIKDIGQWEFLSVADEELVDTIERGFFKDKELVRIYYGTLRLGVDLSKVSEGWIEVKDSVVAVTLPPIELLDSNFIDEARTRAFYESGSWTPAAREALYRKAHMKMLKRCMTKENIAEAEDNAKKQVAQLLDAMGFKNTDIEFKKKE